MDENHMVRNGHRYRAEDGNLCRGCAFWKGEDCVLGGVIKGHCWPGARADGRAINWIDDGPMDEPDTFPAAAPASWKRPIMVSWMWTGDDGIGRLALATATTARSYAGVDASPMTAWRYCVEAARADGWVL